MAGVIYDLLVGEEKRRELESAYVLYETPNERIMLYFKYGGAEIEQDEIKGGVKRFFYKNGGLEIAQDRDYQDNRAGIQEDGSFGICMEDNLALRVVTLLEKEGLLGKFFMIAGQGKNV